MNELEEKLFGDLGAWIEQHVSVRQAGEDKDPKAAGEYLLSMPGSAKRDSAISGFAAGYAWQDPETAIAWAQDIQDPALRTESLKNVGYAYFRRNPDEAKTWLASSGLSTEVQAQIQTPRNRRR